ncbi:MAG: zinc ribbon domain-containing protein [Lentisphaeria bacterium]|nr:zinc ribbon domain-containing protein [Lentisphaeria bacterium]
MKKDFVIRALIMIVSLAAASWLALRLTPMQNEISREKKSLTKAPVAGLHKFLADVAWMRFVNFAGGLSSIDTTNVDKVSAMLKNIIAYDPNFLDSYQCGVLSISNADPKLAVKILSDACSNEHLKHNSQIPFYAGFILSRTIVDQNNPDKILSKPDYAAATKFFRMAIQRSAQPESYIISNYIRSKAKLRGGDEHHAMLAVLYDEWKMAKNSKDEHVDADYCHIPNIEARLMRAAREAKYPVDDDGRPVNPSKATLELVAKVQKEVFADNHLCENCITSTNPGDKFCVVCGKPVKLWGVCSKCSHVLPGNVKFCPDCGTKQ